jgi:hypothetical protein
MTFIASFSLKIIIYIGIYPLFGICRRNIGESTCGDFFLSVCLESKFTKGSTISFASRNFNFTRDSIILSSSRSSSFTRDEPLFTSARSFKFLRTAPASPQPEASALPGNPQTPLQLITQEIPLEPEQTSFPVQETRIEVSVNTCTFISTQQIILNSANLPF